MNNVRSAMVKTLYGPELIAQPRRNTMLKFKIDIRMAVRIMLTLILVSELIIIYFFDKFVKLQQEIFAQGSRIEVEYQRRDNLVPRLSEIAKNYAQHERELMNYISDARTLKQSSQKLKNLLGAAKGAEMEKVFSKLIALVEHYPDLKAERSYKALMEKIVTTENRVATAREEYAALINKYNRTVQTFPYTIFARILKFETIVVYVPEKKLMPEKDKRIFFIY